MRRSVPFIARYDILSGKLSRFRAMLDGHPSISRKNAHLGDPPKSLDSTSGIISKKTAQKISGNISPLFLKPGRSWIAIARTGHGPGLSPITSTSRGPGISSSSKGNCWSPASPEGWIFPITWLKLCNFANF